MNKHGRWLFTMTAVPSTNITGFNTSLKWDYSIKKIPRNSVHEKVSVLSALTIVKFLRQSSDYKSTLVPGVHQCCEHGTLIDGYDQPWNVLVTIIVKICCKMSAVSLAT